MTGGNRGDIVLPEVSAQNWPATGFQQMETRMPPSPNSILSVRQDHLEPREGLAQGSATPLVMGNLISKGQAGSATL